MRSIGITILALLFSMSAFAIAPTNPSLEDLPDLDGWTELPNFGDISGAGYVVRGEDATDGDAFGRLSFFGHTGSFGMAWGPALQSPTFIAGTGEEISLDYRASPGGGHCSVGDPSSGDTGLGIALLMDAATDLPVATFFDVEVCGDPPVWEPSSVFVPVLGEYYILLQVGSIDETGGNVVGAQLDVDNIVSSNLPPDCSEAFANPAMLWPPNHKFFDIAVLGVTDPDGDEFEIVIDTIFQDEPTNSSDDGDTCPDGAGIGTDTASVRAERVGGELGFEGDGRFYWIDFTATDVFGASCSDTVKVSVPHDKQTPAADDGPLFNSSICP